MSAERFRPIIKNYATTLGLSNGHPLCSECWGAVTTDGEWGFERIEEPGTPWIVVHHPRTPEAETLPCWFGTLTAVRQAVERGGIERWLPSVQLAAHDRGEHVQGTPYGCRACDQERLG